MAKDFWHGHSSIMTNEVTSALKSQCVKHSERCLYSSTTLLIWLRFLRKIRIGFVVVPIILGSLAGWDLLKGAGEFNTFTAVCALTAGLVPAVYAALKLDEHLPNAARLAGEYKNLEITFGDLEKVGIFKSFEDFESGYLTARSRLEKANLESYTAPEWCFRSAQKKIEKGHYSFETSTADSKH